MISACAVGSLVLIGRFQPSPTITPSFTITAPTGTSPARSASRANSMARDMNARSASSTGSDAVEELDDASLQRIFGAHDEQPLVPDQLFQQRRAMAQMIDRCAY